MEGQKPSSPVFLKNAVFTVTSVAGFVGVFWLKLGLTCCSNIEMFRNGLGDFQYCFLYGNNECAYDSKVHGLRSRKPLRAETDRQEKYSFTERNCTQITSKIFFNK